MSGLAADDLDQGPSFPVGLWRAGICMILFLYVCLSKQARDAWTLGSQQHLRELAQQALQREPR